MVEKNLEDILGIAINTIGNDCSEAFYMLAEDKRGYLFAARRVNKMYLPLAYRVSQCNATLTPRTHEKKVDVCKLWSYIYLV